MTYSAYWRLDWCKVCGHWIDDHHTPQSCRRREIYHALDDLKDSADANWKLTRQGKPDFGLLKSMIQRGSFCQDIDCPCGYKTEAYPLKKLDRVY